MAGRSQEDEVSELSVWGKGCFPRYDMPVQPVSFKCSKDACSSTETDDLDGYRAVQDSKCTEESAEGEAGGRHELKSGAQFLQGSIS